MQRVFVIGGTGYVGYGIVRRLCEAGIAVAALSRSEAGDERLAGVGATPVRGDDSRADILAAEAKMADGVIYAAWNSPEEFPALKGLIDALADSGKPLIFTSGATVVCELTGGRYSARQVGEDDPYTPLAVSKRPGRERAILESAGRGVRGMVVRPPLVYGDGASVQIPQLAECGMASGSVRFVGPGENLWAYVHRDDLSEMYLRLLERGRAGQAYHIAAGEIAMGELARAIAETLGVDAGSCTEDEAESLYGYWGGRVGLCSSCRPIAPIATAHLEWQPSRRDILEDVRAGSYAEAWRGWRDRRAGGT